MKLSIRMKIFLPVVILLIGFPLATWATLRYSLEVHMNFNARRDLEAMVRTVDGVLEEPEDIVFVASSAHPLAGRKALELKELLPEPFLLTEKDASYRFVLDRYLTSMDLRIEPFLEIGNTEFIIRLLKNNAGISFLPEFSIKNEISAGHLAVLPVKDFHMHIWRQILYHKDKWVTREMDALIRLAQEAP